MEMMIDQMIMLLSSDWFLPYWGMIGQSIDQQLQICVQQGCRAIVKQIVCGVEEYWLASFTVERQAETRSMFEKLSGSCGIQRATLVDIEKWAAISDEEEKVNRLLAFLTDELLSEESTDR